MKKIGVLPCSGACNVGMLTTKATVNAIKRDPDIGFVCALGLPLGIDGIISQARQNESFVALNGCPVKCSTKALSIAKIPAREEIVVSEEYGITKNKNFDDETCLEDLTARLLDIAGHDVENTA